MRTTAAIHVAKKQLGLDDDTYRAICIRVTGQHSSAAMTEGQRLKLIDEFRRQGFKPASKGSRKRLEGKFAAKLQALWIAGWNLGVIRNRADEALIDFVKDITDIDHVRWVHYEADARIAIESLKKWIERKVGPIWYEDTFMPGWRRLDGAKVAAAQWSVLSQQGRLPEPGSFTRYVRAVLSLDDQFDFEELKPQHWQPVMNALGAEIRKTARP
ncbi:regulatory protein GemA [Brucella anthropi]|uniref:regulatory protein GemA n=1 Tax=Brucella anthropi TaxID=529 RepID=UPI00244AEB21|nr:regulatory protein GemA [Brucella anthropi]MDG9793751.1 regulatory protein GemA [Brucella anthropi]MDH0583636.1 regulatory protein GemA [Brucella anthropi]MDH0820141.1 regulatory protein GemA [Brucella anthropi]MDH2086980.1 regulatory protein GemA [Brucella anthropi]